MLRDVELCKRRANQCVGLSYCFFLGFQHVGLRVVVECFQLKGVSVGKGGAFARRVIRRRHSFVFCFGTRFEEEFEDWGRVVKRSFRASEGEGFYFVVVIWHLGRPGSAYGGGRGWGGWRLSTLVAGRGILGLS